MAGQQNLFENNQENLFNKHNKCLIKQVDMWYIKEKFAIETEYDEKKALHEYLLKEMYKTDNCEVIEYLNKKSSEEEHN